MSKILKPYTIVPEHLYVRRSADRQVESIISDMGRPGYVLVSRQMGKTNLLLYAKSKLQTENDAFVYIDLSNIFNSTEKCFENIIDVAIESFPEKFYKVSEEIKKLRSEKNDLPPHKKHINELKLLVNALNGGKLVIILDEIDALTKTNYSDQIFSQIRSMYFASRVNNNSFYNLTYLLSGVVEPNEIIKDPKVSPFNIGQKIYLNDFSKNEFLKFLELANLKLDDECIERIYYWTHGNPRISWDVCSEIEDAILSNELIDIKLIDEIVKKLYLKHYDKPPIDNIREIVSNDKEIRNSIIEIEYGNGKIISDKLKSKLYLSGIINYVDDDIKIKNQIIRESLNFEWIKSIEKEEESYEKIAFDYFSKDNFKEALSFFEKFVENNDESEDRISLHFYYMGICAYRMGHYDKSISYFNKTHFNKDGEKKMFSLLHLYKGLAYYYSSIIDDSLANLQVVIDLEMGDETYLTALLNFATFSLNSPKENLITKAKEIFQKIISDDFCIKEKIDVSIINGIKSICYFNLGLIAKREINNKLAIDNYQKSLENCESDDKAKTLLEVIKLKISSSEKMDLILDLIDVLKNQKNQFEDFKLEKPLIFNIDDFRELVILCFQTNKEILLPKIIPIFNLVKEKSLSKKLYDVAVYAFNEYLDWGVPRDILLEIYKNKENSNYNITQDVYYEVVKLLAHSSNSEVGYNFSVEYIDSLFNKGDKAIDLLDFNIFIGIIYYYYVKKEYTEVLKYVNIINDLKNVVSENLIQNYIAIYHFEINTYNELNLNSKAISKAYEIIEFDKKHKKNINAQLVINEKDINVIKENAKTIINNSFNKQSPAITSKRFGRNDFVKVKYRDGREMNVKFKKIEEDVKKGLCVIINI